MHEPGDFARPREVDWRMSWQELAGRLLRIDDLQKVDRFEFSLAAPWARQSPNLILWGCVALTGIAIALYGRERQLSRPVLRAWLILLRALLLSLLLLLLAEPILSLRYERTQRPWLWLLVDGTASMQIADNLPDEERQRLTDALGPPPGGKSASDSKSSSRLELVRTFLRNDHSGLLHDLQQRYRLRAFTFDRPDGVRELSGNSGDEAVDPGEWANELSADGTVTALGGAIADLARRQPAGTLAGILAFSDFEQNAGPPASEAAARLRVPFYTVGVGAVAATDVAVDLRLPLFLKQGERAALVAVLRGKTLNDEDVRVRLTAHLLGEHGSGSADPIVIGEQSLSLSGGEQTHEFAWVPEQSGRYSLSAELAPVAGEVVTENNHVERAIEVRDDFLRLMFVEFEPTWEWRFIKEVFHRDSLVGQRGFRTFLRSADPRVRQNNELFLPQLTPPRSEFFANDVIFLGDVPASALSTRFCEMTEEFVSRFGGGLVVLSGPRFGPAQLSGTKLAEMLPVVVDRGARARESDGFKLQLTPEAATYDFMQLGATAEESARAWANLGELSWYQPVSRLHPLAIALATHPVDKCADGKTPQPLIAARRYGKGEVIYLGFNETWRLRRRYGELHYRQLWGQMIHRLGLAHALGDQKRFVSRTDRQQYQPDDQVQLTVEAFDENFEPLKEGTLADKALSAEWFSPGGDGDAGASRPLRLVQIREGVFETRFPAVSPGEHKVRITDPITRQPSELTFRVANTSVEQRSVVRNVELQESLARTTGGRSYDLATVSRFAEDFDPPLPRETTIKVISLWDTWIAFVLVVVLMLSEWLIRKLVSLP